MNTLNNYESVLNISNFISHVYQTVDEWKKIKLTVQGTSFSMLDVEKFCSQTEKLNDECQELQSNNSSLSNNLLEEVIVNLGGLIPYIPQLRMLSSGKMEKQHWEKLFDECGQSGKYTPKISITELIEYNILSEKENHVDIEGPISTPRRVPKALRSLA